MWLNDLLSTEMLKATRKACMSLLFLVMQISDVNIHTVHSLCYCAFWAVHWHSCVTVLFLAVHWHSSLHVHLKASIYGTKAPSKTQKMFLEVHFGHCTVLSRI